MPISYAKATALRDFKATYGTRTGSDNCRIMQSGVAALTNCILFALIMQRTATTLPAIGIRSKLTSRTGI
jgi:hypothetical protein